MHQASTVVGMHTLYVLRTETLKESIRFGRILADYADELINLCFDVTSLATFVEFHCLKNDYAKYARSGSRLTLQWSSGKAKLPL